MKSKTGCYDFSVTFVSKVKNKNSSFNFCGVSFQDIDCDLMELGDIREGLRKSGLEIDAKVFDNKFTGQMVIELGALTSFIVPYLRHLQDQSFIAGTSLLKKKLEQQVAAKTLNMSSTPVADKMADKQFFNNDGYKLDNMTILEKGVLKNYLLTSYGAKKTNLKRAASSDGFWNVEKGSIDLEALIASVKKGILLGRFSGGRPNDNGDFSGVAKNSFYIENGKVLYPVKEIMISGNLFSLFNDISSISSQRIDYGTGIMPWITVENIQITGK